MTTETTAKETREFKAELKQLLHLITHSLYSNREIFLRELISNASDAINKVRFDALSHEDKLEGDKDWKIRLTPDLTNNTLMISDNGIGMSRETIVDDLGTIARSGTKKFIESLKQANATERPELIGQFGVGFYSAFMVADRITVVSRPIGSTPDQATRWESDGQGEYTVEPTEKATRGTDVTLHLKDDAKDFLNPWQLRQLVKKFSDFIEHPVELLTEEEDENKTKVPKQETLNSQKAIWLRSKNEVKPEEYTEFYKSISGDDREPARVIHYTAEGSQEFKVLMFIPAHKPFAFHWEEPKPGLKLYIQRVLIMDPCETLLPPYMRFVKGVLDSSDLPLNISRELLQQNPLLESMQKNVIRNVLSGLEALKNLEPEKYKAFFLELGGMIKEGVGRDYANREKLADLLLFESSKSAPGKMISLQEYIDAMPSEQTEIFYLIGENRDILEKSPYLETFRVKNWDVLLLTDPIIDEFFIPSLHEFKGKKLKAVDRAEDESDKSPIEGAEKFTPLLAYLKSQLTEVRDVRLSKRLTDSASCLVGEASSMPKHLEQLMQKMGQMGDADSAKRILELNPNHATVQAVLQLHEKNALDARIEMYGRLLYDQAVIAEGSKVKDPSALARRINELIAKDAATS